MQLLIVTVTTTRQQVESVGVLRTEAVSLITRQPPLSCRSGTSRLVAADGKRIDADHALAAAPSIFDAVVLCPSVAGVHQLTHESAAVDWVRDAFGHLKVIGFSDLGSPIVEAAGRKPEAGMVVLDGPKGVAAFIAAAKGPRIWVREPTLRGPV